MKDLSNRDLIQRDILDFSYDSTNDLKEQSKIKNVLLTGSTGFLGRYLLDALLSYTDANIYCLVRAKNAAEIKDKLNQKLRESDLVFNKERIYLVLGDLHAENLGIADDELRFLEENIDSIYHCGAFVHHLYPYEVLRRDVVATNFLIDFSTKRKEKQLHYISTMNISNAYQDIWRPAILSLIHI